MAKIAPLKGINSSSSVTSTVGAWQVRLPPEQVNKENPRMSEQQHEVDIIVNGRHEEGARTIDFLRTVGHWPSIPFLQMPSYRNFEPR